jgi:hypothetical protein
MRPIATTVNAFALILSTLSAKAGSITYTELVIGSGLFGITNFTNELITLTATADTASITNPVSGLFRVPSSGATISVATVGFGIRLVAQDDRRLLHDREHGAHRHVPGDCHSRALVADPGQHRGFGRLGLWSRRRRVRR